MNRPPLSPLAKTLMDIATPKRVAGPWTGNPDILAFIADFERDHFRSTQDTGANENAMHLWNMVRYRAGLPSLTKDDLPRYDATAGKHGAYVLPEGSKLLGFTP